MNMDFRAAADRVLKGVVSSEPRVPASIVQPTVST